jgi:hypothetical protein
MTRGSRHYVQALRIAIRFILLIERRRCGADIPLKGKLQVTKTNVLWLGQQTHWIVASSSFPIIFGGLIRCGEMMVSLLYDL